jgi:hypothetical protein
MGLPHPPFFHAFQTKTISSYRRREFVENIVEYSRVSEATLPHSHSIILSYGNALIFQRKFFLHSAKNRLCAPSEICALDFKREFRRFKISSVSTTIGIGRSIFDIHSGKCSTDVAAENTVNLGDDKFEQPPMMQGV